MQRSLFWILLLFVVAPNAMAQDPVTRVSDPKIESSPTETCLSEDANARQQPNVTVSPPMNPNEVTVSSIPLSADGWKTFRSTKLHVALDYPPDWAVKEYETGASFTPAQGAGIQLDLIGTGDLSAEDFLNENQIPHARCSSSTNTYGVTVRNCLDTLSGSRIAYFILKPPQGAARLLSLTILRRGNLKVFQTMVDSVRQYDP